MLVSIDASVRASGRRRGVDELPLHDLQQPLHARRAKRAKRPARRPPEQNRVGAKRERLEDVGCHGGIRCR